MKKLFVILFVLFFAVSAFADQIAWDKPAGNITGYVLKFVAADDATDNPNDWPFSYHTTETTVETTLLNLQVDVPYKFACQAYNDAFYSVFSNIIDYTFMKNDPQSVLPPVLYEKPVIGIIRIEGSIEVR